MCEKLSAVPEREIKITEKFTTNDNEMNSKEMLDMLSPQKQAYKFLCIKQRDNNIKVLHSLVLLIAPFGEEEYEQQQLRKLGIIVLAT